MTAGSKSNNAAGIRREINLLELLKNDPKPQAVESEATIMEEVVDLENRSVMMSRCTSESSQLMKETVPIKSVSIPRSSRSQQTKKLDDIITRRHSVSSTIKEKSKLNMTITKRNLEDASFPETR
ncbi:uncharacterized protein B0P05DRAFT_571026 [Gilbertella persicaria]|uniref:uncharacterized protein n=1 Tax=Gilbertella persicaria TaxID=101096 RepID=UPI00221EBD38|nr:uncharacterized protein B0P05DRAFT_571026 [Gilbertella persicaria]KAI8081957.1 hypothetical protein B0P05DRAFT_571026 [Gilbertella persicaria]